MNLGQIRTEFLETSGRLDLVEDHSTTPVTAPRADYFIRSGQRYLDNLADFNKAIAEVPLGLVAGQYAVDLPAVRAVLGVRWENAQGESVTLDHVRLSDLREQYSGIAFENVERSLPTNYTLAILRDGTAAAPDDSEAKRRIVVLPPPDATGTLHVRALLYSNPLEGDDDQSYWSLVHPDVLVLASLMSLEEHYRNTQGVSDYRNAILERMRGISSNLYEEEAANVDQVGNIW